MFKKDKIDEICIKISLYLVISITLIYALSRIIYNVPEILKNIGSGINSFLGMISPLLIGLVIAYLLSPIAKWIGDIVLKKYQKKYKTKKEEERGAKNRIILGVIVTYLLVIFIVIITIYSGYNMISKKIADSNINNPIETISEYVIKYQSNFENLKLNIENLDASDEIKTQLTNLINSISAIITKILMGIIDFAKSFSKNILNFILGMIIAFYIIVDSEFFKEVWQKILKLIMPDRWRIKTNMFLSEIDVVISKFLRGQLLDCLIVGIISALALYFVGIEFAAFLGLFAGVTNIIPYFGPIIGMVPAGIVGLLSGNPIKGLFAVIALVIIQQIDGNILSPRIVGSSVGIHPVFIIISVILGGQLFGLAGMILAVPVAGVIKIIFNKIFLLKEEVR